MDTTLTWADIEGGHYRDWPLKDKHPLIYLRLRALTVTLKAEGVLNLAPASRITPELRDHVKRHRADILSLLQAEPAKQAADPLCITCHRWRCICPE